MELERHVLDTIAGVVDVDFIECIRVEHVKVRAALGILERNVVGQNGDESRTAGFITSEHVQVGCIDRRIHGDVRRFAVAGGLRDRDGDQRHSKCACREGKRTLGASDQMGCIHVYLL